MLSYIYKVLLYVGISFDAVRTPNNALKIALGRLDILREIDNHMGIQTVYAFAVITSVTIQNQQEMKIRDVADALNTSTASATRNVKALVNYGLIELYEKPDNKTSKYIKVTAKGTKLILRLVAVQMRR